jgi:hypothetical protein
MARVALAGRSPPSPADHGQTQGDARAHGRPSATPVDDESAGGGASVHVPDAITRERLSDQGMHVASSAGTANMLMERFSARSREITSGRIASMR